MNLPEFNRQIVPLKDKLFRFAKRITGSGHEAEDVVQEVMEKIWMKRGDENTASVSNWEAWCMTMTRNLSIDKTRSKYRTSVGSLPEKFDLRSSTRSPQQVLESSEIIGNIQKIMANLPEKQRSVMHLRDIEEHSYDEIAQMLNLSNDDVKVTLHRARKAVRELMLGQKF
jgi:RNA polymerase sigma factor (sigma-70 family)